MRTEKQIEAARRNGAKSRGPCTPEGKSKFSANSFRHGRYSQRNSPENDALIIELHAAVNQPPAPRVPPDQSPAALETYFAEIHLWSWARLAALRAFEGRLVNSEIARQRLASPGAHSANPGYRAFVRLCDESRIPDLISRTEDTLCRQWERASQRLSQFQSLHAEIAHSSKNIASKRTRRRAAVTHSAKKNAFKRTRQRTPHRPKTHTHKRPHVKTRALKFSGITGVSDRKAAASCEPAPAPLKALYTFLAWRREKHPTLSHPPVLEFNRRI